MTYCIIEGAALIQHGLKFLQSLSVDKHLLFLLFFVGIFCLRSGRTHTRALLLQLGLLWESNENVK